MNEFTASQLKKPRGIYGWYLFKRLEKFNMPVFANTVCMLDIENGDRVLEIGYGTGRLMRMILDQYAGISMEGIDFSKLMYRKASRLNRAHVAAGRLKLHHVDFLGFNSGGSVFDKIFGLNVIYFFDSSVIDGIYSMLAHGGKLVLYFNDPDQLSRFGLQSSYVFNKYEVDDIAGVMQRSGFREIRVHRYDGENEKGHYLIGVK